MTFEISIHTRAELEESIEAILDGAGYEGVYSFYPVKGEFLEGAKSDFGLVVNFLTEQSPTEALELLQHLLLQNGMHEKDFQLRARELEQTNWRDEWKKFFNPIEVGKRLLILPSWEQDVESGRVVVKIDPGMAFGSGGHGTTLACLEILERTVKGGENVLDFGSGSGILAIAALKLGALRVDAVEIDDVAVENACKNISLNRCDEQVHMICGGAEAIPHEEYDLVLANVTADIIIGNFDEITKYITNESIIVLSGVMENRKCDVDRFLAERSLLPREVIQKGEWFTYLLQGVEKKPSRYL